MYFAITEESCSFQMEPTLHSVIFLPSIIYSIGGETARVFICSKTPAEQVKALNFEKGVVVVFGFCCV